MQVLAGHFISANIESDILFQTWHKADWRCRLHKLYPAVKSLQPGSMFTVLTDLLFKIRLDGTGQVNDLDFNDRQTFPAHVCWNSLMERKLLPRLVCLRTLIKCKANHHLDS